MLKGSLYSIISVIIVSLISFVGLFAFSIGAKKLNKCLLYVVSFAAGALFGDVFIHLFPEIARGPGFTLKTSIYVLLGIGVFFILEKFIHWHHCHNTLEGHKTHPFAFMNLVGDGFHNFIDGMVIAASYIVSVPVGMATTMAVVLHEIPQEIGDYGVLLHGGFSKRKALLLNFLTALTAVFGWLVVILLNGVVENIEFILVPLAAGGFIYIAGSDLIPELHKETNVWRSAGQLISLVLGVLVMVALLAFG